MNYVIMPFATTSRPLTVRGISYRSSDDLDGLGLEEVSHLQTLFKLFYLKEELRFKKMAFCVHTESGQSNYTHFIRRLRESSICLKYICTWPNPVRSSVPILAGLLNSPSTEIAEIFLFHPDNLTASHFYSFNSQENVENVGTGDKRSSSDMLDGYTAITVGRGNYFAIGKTGRIYPPHFVFNNHIAIRYIIDMAAIVDALSHSSKWAIKGFMFSETQEPTALEKRILKTIDWYNSSCEYGIHPYKSMAFLAIAFESLVNLQWGENNTTRFKDILMTLLGSVERLDSWLDQFFAARGDIVHTGEARHLVYFPPGGERGKSKYKVDMPIRLLTEQGRQIFHLCLDAILCSSVTAHDANLHTQFRHDEERISEICKLLDLKDATPPDRRIISVRNIVQELCGNIYQTASWSTAESLVGVSRVIINVYLAGGLHDTLGLPAELVTKMKEFTIMKDSIQQRAKYIVDIARELNICESDNELINELTHDEAFDVLKTLITYAAMYLEGVALGDGDLPPEIMP